MAKNYITETAFKNADLIKLATQAETAAAHHIHRTLLTGYANNAHQINRTMLTGYAENAQLARS